MARRTSIYPAGFAHANPVPAASRIDSLLVSGALTGRDAQTRRMPADLATQVANVFGHVRELMAAAGGSTDDIIKMTFRLAAYRDRDALNAQWEAMFPDPDDRPARHCLAATLDNGSLIQADLMAVLGTTP
jgi:enamine deaminase RidA (YjgF/YER057c/UK114 family)